MLKNLISWAENAHVWSLAKGDVCGWGKLEQIPAVSPARVRRRADRGNIVFLLKKKPCLFLYRTPEGLKVETSSVSSFHRGAGPCLSLGGNHSWVLMGLLMN